MTRDTHDNENEPLTFIQLGLQTALVLNRIRNAQTLLELAKRNEQENEQANGKAGSCDADNKHTDEHAEYVDQRLRELAAFERRASGLNKKRSR